MTETEKLILLVLGLFIVLTSVDTTATYYGVHGIGTLGESNELIKDLVHTGNFWFILFKAFILPALLAVSTIALTKKNLLPRLHFVGLFALNEFYSFIVAKNMLLLVLPTRQSGDMTVIQLGTFFLGLASIVVTGVLIGVLSVQRVYAHIRAVKRLFLVTVIAFLAINMLLFVRRFIPFDEAATRLALRTTFSLTLSVAATMGSAATILYTKPKSTSTKELYADTVKKMFLPYLSYMIILFILFSLAWTLPIPLELKSYPTSQIAMYVPAFGPHILISLAIGFAAFISYPTALLFLASRAAENVAVSRELRIIAACAVGLAVSVLLQPFFLNMCFAEAVDIIRIPCLIAMTYVFKEVTSLQRLDETELREYIEELKATKSDEQRL